MTKEEAINKIRQWDFLNDEQRKVIETICPELTESENDKTIRLLKKLVDNNEILSREAINNCYVWLEKQKDYNFINFKEAEKEKKEYISNDFMLCKANYQDFKDGEHYWLEYIGDDEYNVRSDNLLGKTYHITPQALYLVFRPLTWLEKQKPVNNQFTPKQASILDKHIDKFLDQKLVKEMNGDDYGIEGINTAVDILETTLGKVEGYQSDDGILEHKTAIAAVKKIKEQKSAKWSEEDEKMFDFAIRAIGLCKQYAINNQVNGYSNLPDIPQKYRELQDWFKHLKDRCIPQSKQEWSEEDENAIEVIQNIIRYSNKIDANIYTNEVKERLFSWVKSLKPNNWKPVEYNEKYVAKVFEKVGLAKIARELANVKLINALQDVMIELCDHQNPIKQDTEIRDIWEYIREWKEKFGRLPKDEDELSSCIYYVMKRQKKYEWSGEDELLLHNIIKDIEQLQSVSKIEQLSDIYSKEINWLEAIKLKLRWKPSDEQMNTLEYYMHTLTCNKHKEILFGLYTDLKKLRNEQI